MMEVECTVNCPAFPVPKLYRFSSASQFSRDTSFRSSVLALLRNQRFNLDRIQLIQYRTSPVEPWTELRETVPPFASPQTTLHLNVTLRPCECGAKMGELDAELLKLRAEAQQLRQELMDLLAHSRLSPILSAVQQAVVGQPKLTRKALSGSVPEVPESLSVNQPSGTLPVMDRVKSYLPDVANSAGPGKKQIDLIYLCSKPLVKPVSKGFRSLGNHIDLYKEVELISTILNKAHKEICARVTRASFDKLRKAIEVHPRVIHISCSGGYEMEDGVPKASLYLGSNEQIGVADKYDIDTLQRFFEGELRETSDSAHRIELLIISSVFAQEFGEAIWRAGVPSVISIVQAAEDHENNESGDGESAFLRDLYGRLLSGETLESAFDHAKEVSKRAEPNLRLCCCSHVHNEGCSWAERLVEDPEETHAKHVPECGCVGCGGNIHSKTCGWVQSMQDCDYATVPAEKMPNSVKACCCRPSLEHGHDDKFVLFSRSAKLRVFTNLQQGEPIVSKPFEFRAVPLVSEQLIGKNVELHKLVAKLVSSSSRQCNIVSLAGPRGAGKTLLAMTAARFCVERGFFKDGVAVIKTQSATWLLSTLNASLLPPPQKEAKDFTELGQRTSGVQKLIVIKCWDVPEQDITRLVKDLKAIVVQAREMMFVLVRGNSFVDPQVDEITVDGTVSPIAAYSIVKRNNPRWPYSYREFVTFDLARVLTSPWLCKKAACLLKSNSPDEVCNMLSKIRVVCTEGACCIDAVEDSYRAMKERCGSHEPMTVLAHMPSWLLEADLQAMCSPGAFAGWKDQARDFINEQSRGQTLVFARYAEEMKEFWYRITDVARKYVTTRTMTEDEAARGQVRCLEHLSALARKILDSFNIGHYKCLSFNEFSAIINSGIWKARTPTKGVLLDCKLRFQYEKDNFLHFLDPQQLSKLFIRVKSNKDLLLQFIACEKELAICTFSMMCYLLRPLEAMQVAQQVQKFFCDLAMESTYGAGEDPVRKLCASVQGTMKLLTCGLGLMEPETMDSLRLWKESRSAGTLFRNAGRQDGIGEALYLQGLFYGGLRTVEEARVAFGSARDAFTETENAIGLARVNIAEANLLIEKASDELCKKIGCVDRLLSEALNILSRNPYYDNMEAEAYYYKAVCAEKGKDYEAMRQCLTAATEKCRFVGNQSLELKCLALQNKTADCFQQDSPLLCFLKSFPLVRRTAETELEALPPNVSRPSLFRANMLQTLECVQKAVKVHFDTLTRKSLEEVLARRCAILHISTKCHSPDSVCFEGELGELDEMPLEEFKEFLQIHLNPAQCRLVIVAIPDGLDIASAFLSVGVPHVVLLQFNYDSAEAQKRLVQLHNLDAEAKLSFDIELYNALLSGSSVAEGWRNARDALVELARSKLARFGVRQVGFSPEILPRLLPEPEEMHKAKVFASLAMGKPIDTSPHRGICNINKERKPFVARQIEVYKLACLLRERQCVNLYGEAGVGKSQIAVEVGYFLHMHSLFKLGIHYCSAIRDLHEPGRYLNLETAWCGKNPQLLFIVDGLNETVWRNEARFCRSMQQDKDCVFLLISRQPLPLEGDFPLVPFEVLPYSDPQISVAYILSRLEYYQYKVTWTYNRESKNFEDELLRSRAFKQAGGYQRLLDFVCERICDSVPLKEINLMRDPIVDEEQRKLIKFRDTDSRRNSGAGIDISNIRTPRSAKPKTNGGDSSGRSKRIAHANSRSKMVTLKTSGKGLGRAGSRSQLKMDRVEESVMRRSTLARVTSQKDLVALAASESIPKTPAGDDRRKMTMTDFN